MNTERRASTGPPARRATPRIPLIALALVAIGLEGCQSLQSINPFRNCCGGGLSRLGSGRGLGSAGGIGGGGGLFHRHRDRAIYDEPPIFVEPEVEVLPGEPVIIDPGPSIEAPLSGPDPGLAPIPDVRPPDDALELELNPLPESSSRNDGGTINSKANSDQKLGARSIDRASESSSTISRFPGDAYADRMARRSNDVILDRSQPEAAEDGPKPPLSTSLRAIDSLGQLEAIRPPGPGPSEAVGPLPPEAAPPPAPAPEAEPLPALESGPEAPPPRPAEPPEDPVDLSTLVPTIPEGSPEAGEPSGIAPFFSVEPLLAGGAAPEGAGWEALADRGYRTVLDLRPFDQVRPEDIASSNRLGLRHVLLPINPGMIDAPLVRRFEDELSQDSARPIFFCDTDGSAAAALWYIHRISVDQYSHERALRDAERIASIPPDLRLAAQDYLDRQRSAASPEFSTAPIEVGVSTGPEPEAAPVASTTDAAPKAMTDPEVSPEPEPTVAEQSEEASAPEAAEVSVAEVFEDPFAKPAPIQAKGWGPYAALFLTILAVPLAYWSSTGMPGGLRSRALASLSGPGRRPQSLPASSDAGT